ncbi:putative F-box domain, FBD domain, leucine-rich repeat domain, L domain-containing protein [Medicago truncatula]|uniref:F-box/RNI/FBD-like domain protein n=1 Tax=Medicago truncatula TaxID=3880 RepID=A0A072V840_MEDTR|nr:F-box/FBD/LRR-repeat protein At1g13570 [Medicago truncatula]XP_024632375.1 F-box/FBD/LRR-repeat protein At1g13570 [Medicago truncatula]XP_024632376.1 F-box/FBD/LRR-repeat protein At1g13570 [Medicago truncatula]KEH37791.1 F-box/RNI/FBD-like domain protein [Medicago truncatula]RHN73865.1 putative F-box domain, FBD domain, leucine-rich repeat domain, L domain-containing protein [Medicago truncatula]
MTDKESDRISCLPDHIIDHFLSRLSIKEAGRTSVLSNKWRKKWSTQPDLVFDKQCVSAAVSEDPSVIENKFVRTVDHVLLLHSGPINKFKISDFGCDFIGMISVADVDRWILHLTRRSIKNLELDIWFEQRYNIPWCLFSCQSLHHLNLFCSSLKPPAMFEGFMNLKSLQLEQVTVAKDAFENLISGSPLLEKLVLKKVDGFTQINIHSPSIKYVDIRGNFEGISFDNTSQLAKVFVNLSSYLNSETGQSMFHGCSSNLLKFFDHLHNIQSLLIASYSIKYLAAGVVPVKLPTLCINLTFLSICLNFNDLTEISAVLCLLKSSPNLQTFKMFARLKEETDLLTHTSYCWEDIFSEPDMLLKLQHVEIQDISGTKSELDFIRFLLLYSPVLKKMIVEPVENVKPELITELIRFRRASEQAEVIYKAKDS